MIKIKLDELLKEYDVTITEISDATGISRSTLTPLVNNPKQVKGLKIETIDTLCDFFGIHIQDFIEFSPTKSKYNIKTFWGTGDALNYTFLLSKTIGSKERLALLTVQMKGFSSDPNNESTLIFNGYTNFLNLEETKKYLDEVLADGDKYDINSFAKNNIFLNDISKQSSKNIESVTKIISKIMKTHINSIEEHQDISGIELNWILPNNELNKFKSYIYDFETEEVKESDATFHLHFKKEL
ncbi:helix-turn-helix domain-containing protein [Vagococcus xieshaowenii]|uniref:helix-turn-helix domain-containing protein n=1 Tax=Vagococcus xieshaowenii TaxID=2562451 RepID=UPI001432776D|nr:helix-turn-helix transcriptional regulator [Vagococcus xieshaowenii]